MILFADSNRSIYNAKPDSVGRLTPGPIICDSRLEVLIRRRRAGGSTNGA